VPFERQVTPAPTALRWLRRPLVPTAAALLVWVVNSAVLAFEPGGGCTQREATSFLYFMATAVVLAAMIGEGWSARSRGRGTLATIVCALLGGLAATVLTFLVFLFASGLRGCIA